MNCAYENYLYIYNIKLMEKNTLLIKKITLKYFYFIFENKNYFSESSFQT